jgi:hypothetical protein
LKQLWELSLPTDLSILTASVILSGAPLNLASDVVFGAILRLCLYPKKTFKEIRLAQDLLKKKGCPGRNKTMTKNENLNVQTATSAANKAIKTKGELFLESLRITGNPELSRLCVGATQSDLLAISEHELLAAEQCYHQERVEDAVRLLKRARDIALITESPIDCINVAEVLCPELAVFPKERLRAKAKAESGSSAQVQVNIALAELGERLQQSLREQASLE